MTRAGLSRDKVLAAAVRLVDEHGLEELSMRRLGLVLGVEAMSLYRHVRDKGDVLDGVHETILGEMRLPRPSGDWEADVRALAHAFRKVLRAHPNALPIFAARPAVTPASLHYVERALAALEGAELEEAERIYAFETLAAFVIGHTSLWCAPTPAPSARVAYGELDGERFPLLRSHATTIARLSVDREFAFGLDALIRGIERRRESAGGE
jgi:AcrR family transcriptional regulator